MQADSIDKMSVLNRLQSARSLYE